MSEKTATTGFEPETSGFQALFLTHSAIAATQQELKAIKYLNVELPSTKKLNLTNPRPNPNLGWFFGSEGT